MAEVSSVASATPWGAIIGGASSVLNNVVSNIFGAKQRKKEFELKVQEQHFQQALAGLGNQQQYVLQSQLNAANTDTDRYNILTNAVTQIKLNSQTVKASSSNQTTYLILGVLFLAVIALLVIKKN
jgi:CRISPR/Cas system CMR-associated protein Cmr1 (group 7 of RAMP superfamily)